MTELEEFPFALGPRGRVLVEQYDQRLRDDPLGEVRMPSGDVARLAVRHADSAQVMTDPRFTKDLSWPGAPRMYPGVNIVADPDVISNMEGERHARLRRLLAGCFTPAKIAGWRPRVRALAETLLDGLPGPEIDFVNEVALPFAIRVICEVVGVPELDAARIQKWADQLMPSSTPALEEQMGTLGEVAEYLLRLIAETRQDPGDSILGTMIQARDNGQALTDEEMVRTTVAIALAGHESTASVLSRGLLRLLDPPDGWRQLVARPELVDTMVEELLRVEVPGDGASIRVATEDVELPSGPVRKGEAVIPSFVGPNNDPAVNDSPAEFRLDRANPRHLTFGWGTHFCLGANVARMELREIFAVIIERFSDLALAEPADGVSWTTMAIKRPTRLLLRVR